MHCTDAVAIVLVLNCDVTCSGELGDQRLHVLGPGAAHPARGPRTAAQPEVGPALDIVDIVDM